MYVFKSAHIENIVILFCFIVLILQVSILDCLHCFYFAFACLISFHCCSRSLPKSFDFVKLWNKFKSNYALKRAIFL